MSVKGLPQHRLVGQAMVLMLADSALTEEQREDCVRLRKRAELAIDRLNTRKRARAERGRR